MSFGFDDFVSSGLDFASAEYFRDKASDEATTNRQYSADEAAKNRDFQERMRATQYQTTVSDLKAAGLNPALAYMHGGAGTPAGAMGSASSASGVSAPQPSESMYRSQQSATSAQQQRLLQAQEDQVVAVTDKTRAEEAEIKARTPTYEVSIAHVRQQINESIERVGAIVAQAHQSWASAAQSEQQTRNLKEAIPQIRATVEQLKAFTEKASSESAEIKQRVSANLPALQRALQELEQYGRQLDMPRREQESSAHDRFVGALGAVMRILNPLNGFLGR